LKTIINSTKAPAPVGPYNQAIMANGTLYISGQIAIDAKIGEIVNANIEKETEQVLKNLSYILAEAGLTKEDVIKCSVFVSDMKNYAKINKVYSAFFGEENAPARELVEVSALPKYVNVEISAIAVTR